MGDIEKAGEMLFAPTGISDDELADILDYEIDGESAVLWCRRQDARKFKREKCAQTGTLVFSLSIRGSEKPRYFELSVIKKNLPEERQRLRKRVLRALARQIKTLSVLELSDSSRLNITSVEDEILEIVREMFAEALRGGLSEKSA
jgi:hypothetical protein